MKFIEFSTSSISPITTSAFLNSIAASSSSVSGSILSQQQSVQPHHSIHSQLHGRLSAPNGLGSIPSDEDDIEEDDDAVDGDTDPNEAAQNSRRDGKRMASQLNGDKSDKPRKKKTRTVFSRSQVDNITLKA